MANTSDKKNISTNIRRALEQKRTNTRLGIQGDHISAHSLFKEIILNIILDSENLKDACIRILMLIDEYLSKEDGTKKEKDEREEKVKTLFERFTALVDRLDDEEKRISGYLNIEIINKIFENYIYSSFETEVSFLIDTHFALRNYLRLVSVPRVSCFLPPKNEGTLIKGALSFFRKLKEEAVRVNVGQLKIISDTLESDDSESDSQSSGYSDFQNEYIIEDEIVNKKLNTIVENMCHLIFYPPINASFDDLKIVLKEHINLIFKSFSFFMYLSGKQKEKIAREFIQIFLSKEWNVDVTKNITSKTYTSWNKNPNIKKEDIENNVINMSKSSFEGIGSQSASHEETPEPERSRSSSFISDSGTDSTSEVSLKSLPIDFQKEKILSFSRFDGFEYEEVLGDGNCFFSALALLFNRQKYQGRNTWDAYEIRLQILSFLLKNKERFERFFDDNESLNEYVRRMARDGEWAEDHITNVVGEVFNIRLTLVDWISTSHIRWIYLNDQNPNLSLFTLLRTGEREGVQHYAALHEVLGNQNSSNRNIDFDIEQKDIKTSKNPSIFLSNISKRNNKDMEDDLSKKDNSSNKRRKHN